MKHEDTPDGIIPIESPYPLEEVGLLMENKSSKKLFAYRVNMDTHNGNQFRSIIFRESLTDKFDRAPEWDIYYRN